MKVRREKDKTVFDDKRWAWVETITNFESPNRTWAGRVWSRILGCLVILRGDFTYLIYENLHHSFFKENKVVKREMIYYLKKEKENGENNSSGKVKK